MSDNPKDSDGLTPENPDESNADGMHFSEEELEAAMAGFEREFQEAEAAKQDSAPAERDEQSSPDAETSDEASDTDAGGVVDAAETSLDFEDELQGLLGNRAKMAAIITRLTSARLLAAFCELSDVSAQCIDSEQGAVAVLRNLQGDGPEAAVRDMTVVISGMPAVLAVNRADKLEATLYVDGKSVRTFAPPILFTSTASFVEDLMLGIDDLEGLRKNGLNIVDSASIDHDEAMKIIAEHTRFGRGGSSID